MPNAKTLIRTEDTLKLIDEIFLLPPKTKRELKEAFPYMSDEKKEEFSDYLDSILKKQDEVLGYLVQNNPDFIKELKMLGKVSTAKKLKSIEKESLAHEELDVVALEEALKKL